MKYLPNLAIVLLSLTGCVTGGKMSPQVCFHENEAVEAEIGYCQALRDGDTLHISGVAGQGEMADAIKSVYTRLGHVLQANGLSFADVVKENVYATDLDAFIRNKALRTEFYAGHLPSATWVQVQRLYVPSFVVEIELAARYPK